MRCPSHVPPVAPDASKPVNKASASSHMFQTDQLSQLVLRVPLAESLARHRIFKFSHLGGSDASEGWRSRPCGPCCDSVCAPHGLRVRAFSLGAALEVWISAVQPHI